MARTLLFHELRGVLFDVDGTLYDQRPLRRRMLRQLSALPLREGLKTARRTWRAISAFRKTLEELRECAPGCGLESLRYERAAERAGIPTAELRGVVDDWMLTRPIPLIGGCARPGMREFIHWLEQRGRRVGVLSDYPPGTKLEALGIASSCRLRLCSTDADIDAFKPHPHGFERALAIWQLAPNNLLYVGDRASVDAAGAKAAGMPCVIIGKRGLGRSFVGVRGFDELRRRLEQTG